MIFKTTDCRLVNCFINCRVTAMGARRNTSKLTFSTLWAIFCVHARWKSTKMTKHLRNRSMNIESFPPYDPLPDGYRRESFVPCNFCLCRKSFCMCHEVFVCAVRVYVCVVEFLFAPWHPWATVIYRLIILRSWMSTIIVDLSVIFRNLTYEL